MRRQSLIVASLVLVAGCSLPTASQAGGSSTSAATTDTSGAGGTAPGDTAAPESDTGGDTASSDTEGDTVSSDTGGDTASSDTDGDTVPSDDSGTGGPAPSDGPVVTSTRGVRQDLHQANFFNSEGWAERNTRVPLVGPVFGMVQQLQPNGSECPTEDSEEFPVSTSPLELRLDGNPGTLGVTVGQTTNSTDSDVLLDAKLLVDGAPSKTATFKYNQTKTLTTPVEGVSVVKLIVSVDATSETCATEAVAYNIAIQGG